MIIGLRNFSTKTGAAPSAATSSGMVGAKARKAANDHFRCNSIMLEPALIMTK